MSPAPREADLEAVVLDLLGTLGWSVRHGPEIAPGELAAERGDYREVVLIERLRDAVVGLNPGIPLDAVEDAVKTALRPESQVAESENWRAYRLLVEGVPVDFRSTDGSIRSARARLIDFDEPGNNDYLAVNQFTVLGTRERRPDVVLFVNGLPLVLMELKRPGDGNATLRGAFNQVQTYRAQIPDIFTWNQVTVISDGTQARAGSFIPEGAGRCQAGFRPAVSRQQGCLQGMLKWPRGSAFLRAGAVFVRAGGLGPGPGGVRPA